MKQHSMRFIFKMILIMSLLLIGCSGKHLRVNDDNTAELYGCYPLPNCVSSNTWVPYNWTPKFEPAIPQDEAWIKIKKVLSEWPRTKIIEENNIYIHAKCTSLVFRFVDNLELLLHPEQNLISVRSSSTIALWDIGVNHWRIYKLRSQLKELNIIK